MFINTNKLETPLLATVRVTQIYVFSLIFAIFNLQSARKLTRAVLSQIVRFTLACDIVYKIGSIRRANIETAFYFPPSGGGDGVGEKRFFDGRQRRPLGDFRFRGGYYVWRGEKTFLP